MSKFKYTKFEKEMNVVLKHQDDAIANINFPSKDETEKMIDKTENMLRSLGIDPNVIDNLKPIESKKRIIEIPTWDELYQKSLLEVGTNCSLDELFTECELKENESYIRHLNKEYNTIHQLDNIDIAISATAGLIASAVDILLVGIPEKTKTGMKAGTLSNYIRDYFDKKFPEEEMQKLANKKISKVPFDAQDNRNTTIYVEGLSAYYHRLLQLGHDPLLGLVFGVSDILNGRMTTIDKTGKFVSQVMENYADRKESEIFAAIAKLIIHFKSDITTSMGLPAPLMGLFNLLQFGSIGEEELTIAEIVQGMYYEGYDFIHFCSMSIPTMIVEVIVRLGYALKRIKEGKSIKDSIPFSLNRENHPKLATMLFIAHTSATAINAGKVYFSKNPMAINYPEWIAFGRYTYTQLKWMIIEKPNYKDKYVRNAINNELQSIIDDINSTFDEFCSGCTIIFR